MKSNTIAIMGYPDRLNQHRMNSNRNSSNISSGQNNKKKQKQ